MSDLIRRKDVIDEIDRYSEENLNLMTAWVADEIKAGIELLPAVVHLPAGKRKISPDQLILLQGLLSSCGAWFTSDIEEALRAAVRALGGKA